VLQDISSSAVLIKEIFQQNISTRRATKAGESCCRRGKEREEKGDCKFTRYPWSKKTGE
jgi:hypothetical protein